MIPTRKNPTPPVNAKYGAPMGRPDSHPGDAAVIEGKFWLRRVYLNSGGYDPGGAYWGIGEPLYFFEGPEGVHGYVRGATRDAAKRVIREACPGAKFAR